jgi:hypothetical protein
MTYAEMVFDASIDLFFYGFGMISAVFLQFINERAGR